MSKQLKPAKGDKVMLDGGECIVRGFQGAAAILDGIMTGHPDVEDGTPKEVFCHAKELQWAPEGFWYLPKRVGPHIPDHLRDAVRHHPAYLRGRDDLALKAIQAAMEA